MNPDFKFCFYKNIMKIKLIDLIILVPTLFASCSKDLPVDNFPDESYSIKSVWSDGKNSAKYIYNKDGKIIESQGFYYFKKFNYDLNGRLVKKEIAVDPDIASSTMHEKTELMTSENSTFTGYSEFEYDGDSKLMIIKNYVKENDQYEYISMNSVEYEGDKIVRMNLHDAQNIMTQCYTYEYDGSGNVIKEKYYSYLFLVGTEPKLISEVSFKFDNKNNPYRIYKDLGLPGLYSNKNNILETSTILYVDVPGIDKYTTSKTAYEYNDQGFPVKVSTDNSLYEYKYE